MHLIFIGKQPLGERWDFFKTCTFEATPVMGKVWGRFVEPWGAAGRCQEMPRALQTDQREPVGWARCQAEPGVTSCLPTLPAAVPEVRLLARGQEAGLNATAGRGGHGQIVLLL